MRSCKGDNLKMNKGLATEIMVARDHFPLWGSVHQLHDVMRH